MRATPGWNVDGDLLWGYFFLDPDPANLRRAADELQAVGYRIVGIDRTDDGFTYRLHAEKVETHSPVSLNERNAQLYTLAETLGLASYDGMDVGPAPAPTR